MTTLYFIFIKFFSWLLKIASNVNPKANLLHQGRKETYDKISSFFTDRNAKVAWFHCASLGEFEQGRPLIEAFKKQYPHYKIFLTFFSPSGYEIRKNYANADCVAYLPADTPENAKTLIEIVNPKIAFFIKYEFWHFYFKELKVTNVPLFSVSSIFRPNQSFFQFYGAFFRTTLHSVTHFFVQNLKSNLLLYKIGFQNVTIAGDTRFDRVKSVFEAKKTIPIAENFKSNKLTLVIGSSWDIDITMISKAFQKGNIALKLIIAPHEIHEQSINHIIQSFPQKKIIKYSEANENNHSNNYDILIIDNIGMLSSLYQYGEIAYIGGAFGKGLHNILEAAVYGIPVIFGSKYSKFQEATDLIGKEGSFSVNNEEELYFILKKLTENQEKRQKSGKICQEYIWSKIGATDLIMQHIAKYL
jgi:3-deoxy-D-manno-octulosonic-acid transferase